MYVAVHHLARLCVYTLDNENCRRSNMCLLRSYMCLSARM